MLTAQQNAILIEAFTAKLSPHGFTFAGKKTWARARKPHICELVRFYHTRSSSTPLWGLALDFVPEVSGSRLKWKRLPQDLHFDLQWQPLWYDEAIRAQHAEGYARFLKKLRNATLAGGWLEPIDSSAPREKHAEDKWFVQHPLDGAVTFTFTREAEALAQLTAAEVVPFLDRIHDLNSVAELLAFQSSYTYSGLTDFTNHAELAYAFLLAKLGRSEEARCIYKSYSQKVIIAEAVRPKLDAAFEKALASSFVAPS